jgi:hypothetical protein
MKSCVSLKVCHFQAGRKTKKFLERERMKRPDRPRLLLREFSHKHEKKIAWEILAPQKGLRDCRIDRGARAIILCNRNA